MKRLEFIERTVIDVDDDIQFDLDLDDIQKVKDALRNNKLKYIEVSRTIIEDGEVIEDESLTGYELLEVMKENLGLY